ncbi:anti-sigma factor family protein, partial [Bordetella petrii]|uniref:anti-sigma factor family protein n=1 Tax=Bordetella petrii TaxID=94624 RepID=UPI003AF33542|nr:anti-sigma factor [Bordetella petrii]
MNKQSIDDLARNAFVDGQLDPARQQAMQVYLQAHPEQAQELAAWQRDAQRLRDMAGQDSMPPNPALDPAAV